MIVVVPNELHDCIRAAIVGALNGRPCSDDDREILYRQILSYFNEHGFIPDFSLKESP